MRNEIKLFFTSLMFFTRIPVPKNIGFSIQQLNKSNKYFPLVGGVVGLIGALFFYGAQWVFPVSLAIIVSMIATIFSTGAFHEDGFADFCDGYGGGYTKDKILTIMKDSRLGTYGTTGLLSVLAIKFTSLSELNPLQIPSVLIAAHILSRVSPLFLIYTATYVSNGDASKAKPVGDDISFTSILFAIGTTVPVFFLVDVECILWFIGINTVLFFLFRKYIIAKTGGYTGDVLGALQQLSEISFYLLMVAMQFHSSLKIDLPWNLF